MELHHEEKIRLNLFFLEMALLESEFLETAPQESCFGSLFFLSVVYWHQWFLLRVVRDNILAHIPSSIKRQSAPMAGEMIYLAHLGKTLILGHG